MRKYLTLLIALSFVVLITNFGLTLAYENPNGRVPMEPFRDREEMREAIKKILSEGGPAPKISARQRQGLYEDYMNGVSVEDLASRYKISPATVTSILRDFSGQLKELNNTFLDNLKLEMSAREGGNPSPSFLAGLRDTRKRLLEIVDLPSKMREDLIAEEKKQEREFQITQRAKEVKKLQGRNWWLNIFGGRASRQ